MHKLIFYAVHSLQHNQLLFSISLKISTVWQMQNKQWLSTLKSLPPRTE